MYLSERIARIRVATSSAVLGLLWQLLTALATRTLPKTPILPRASVYGTEGYWFESSGVYLLKNSTSAKMME